VIFKNLGHTGLKVSTLCLGTMQMGWTADEEVSTRILDEAFHAGINFIDTADVYSRWVEGNPGGVAEEIIGRWLKNSRVPRDQIVLATKVRGPMGTGPNDEGLSRCHIINAVENSLRRLQTDVIDLYQAHSPDASTPLEETLSAFDSLVHQGKVRYIGCSNFPAWLLVRGLWISERDHLSRFDCLQPHYNLVHRHEYETELREACRAFGIGVIPYSPLAGGFLTGKYRRDSAGAISQRQGRVSKYFTEKNWALLDLLDTVAAAHPPATLSQVALAWILEDKTITSPIIGPRSVEQLNDNLGALDLALTREEVEQIHSASGGDLSLT